MESGQRRLWIRSFFGSCCDSTVFNFAGLEFLEACLAVEIKTATFYPWKSLCSCNFQSLKQHWCIEPRIPNHKAIPHRWKWQSLTWTRLARAGGSHGRSFLNFHDCFLEINDLSLEKKNWRRFLHRSRQLISFGRSTCKALWHVRRF